MHVEGVPFARDGARFTRDFENLVAWLTTKTDKTATCRMAWIDSQPSRRIIERVGEEMLAAKAQLCNPIKISIESVNTQTLTRARVRVTAPTNMPGEPNSLARFAASVRER